MTIKYIIYSTENTHKKETQMVLIIDKSRKTSNSLKDAFYYMGVIATVKTPSEALAEISIGYRAIIINGPEKLPDKCDYMRRLRSYLSDVPVFAAIR